MTKRPTRTLAAVALLAAVAACGSADPSATSPSTTPTHSTQSSDGGVTVSPPHDFPAAQQVTVRVSGGLRPVDQTLVFATDQPAPEGFTTKDVAAVLRAAADPELKDPPSEPGDTCCDMYIYRVTISYPDGTSSSFTAVRGAGSSDAVQQLLSMVA